MIGVGVGLGVNRSAISALGSLAGSLADATLSGAAKIIVTGVMAVTLGNATGVSTGIAPAHGTASITLDDAAAAGTGTVKVQSAAAVTTADAILSAAGTVKVQGVLAATLGAATLAATGTVSGGSELFPDPTLASTGNAALWEFGSAGISPANSGAGPDILVDNADSNNDDVAFLTISGSFNTALLVAWPASTTKTVSLTVGSFAAAGSIFVRMRIGDPVEFAFSANQTVSHSVTAGTDILESFKIVGPDGADGGVFTPTDISVT